MPRSCATCGAYVCGRCHNLSAVRAAGKRGMSMHVDAEKINYCKGWSDGKVTEQRGEGWAGWRVNK